MADYREYDNSPQRPCRPQEHQWSMNGNCWKCNNTRSYLLATAREIVELSKEGKF